LLRGSRAGTNDDESRLHMGLFKPDFFRSFAIGFALGAVLVFTQMGDGANGGIADSVVPTAVAAPVPN
jgi:hypothetical protein